MEAIPELLTNNEISEVAEVICKDNDGYFETVEEEEEEIRTHWSYKIDKFSTDYPGYSGILYVIVLGAEGAVITLERAEDDSLRARYLHD